MVRRYERRTSEDRPRYEADYRHERRRIVYQSSNILYALGVIGSAIYYVVNATNFLDGLWGLVKAILWPAFLVYELLGFLGM